MSEYIKPLLFIGGCLVGYLVIYLIMRYLRGID